MAEIIACNGNELTIQVTIKLTGSLLRWKIRYWIALMKWVVWQPQKH